MRRFVIGGIVLLALVHAPTLTSALPAGLANVDPAAPCFRWPAVDMDGDGVFDRLDKCVNTPRGCTVDEWGCSSDNDGDGVCDGIDRCPDTPNGATVDEFGCPEGRSAVTPPVTPRPVPKEVPPPPPVKAPVNEIERQLVETGLIRLENVYFETGSAKLLPESETTLRELGETLERYPKLKLEVQGHTDTRGKAEYNLRLSDSRASSVRAFLVEHFELEPDHLIAKGYGETEPETDEHNQEELLRNRRVVLKVLNPESLPKGVKVEHE